MSQLKGKEFIEEGFFNDLKKGAEESLKIVTDLKKALQSDLKSKSSINLVEPKTIQDINAFNKSVKETKTVIDNLTKAEAKELELQKEISKLKTDPIYQKQAKEIERLRQEKNAINKATREEVQSERNVNNEYARLSKTLNDLRNKYKNLAVAGKQNTKEAKDLLAQITPLDKKLKQVDETVGQSFRKIGDYGSGLNGLTSRIKGLLTIGVATSLVNGLVEVNKEVRKGTQLAKTFFDLSNEGARELTVKARGLSQAYGLELNDTLETANVLSKQFGVSGTDALDLIEKGIGKGANVTGEFLENLKEYSTQFRLAGLSADESIALITQQVKEGVFSDKGVDAIKEATLSLREMTPATVEALKRIGLSSEQIQKDIQSGAKTYFDVIQEVSNKTKEFGEDSAEAGVILADVFKGAGEDAGDFIFKLGDVNLKLDEQASILTEAEEAQIALDKSWNEFVTNVSDGSGIIGQAFTKIKEGIGFVIKSLNDFFRTVDQKINIITNSSSKATRKIIDDVISGFDKLNELSNKQLNEILKTSTNRAEIGNINSIIEGRTKNLEKSQIRINRLNEIIERSNENIVGSYERLKRAEEEFIKGDGKGGLKAKLQEARAEYDLYAVSIEIATKELLGNNLEIKDNTNSIDKNTKSTKDNNEAKRESVKLLRYEKEAREDLAKDIERDSELQEKTKEEFSKIADFFNKKEIDSENEKLKKIKETYQSLNNIADAFYKREQERSDKQIENIDKEIDASRSRIDYLRQFALEGNLNASNSIAVEEKRQAEATLKKEKEIQKQKRIESSLALLKTYTSSLESGQTPSQALAQVLENGTLLAELINALPSFDVGTDNTSKHIAGANGGVDGKGGFLAINHPNEKIFNSSDSAKIGFDVPNSEVADTFGMVRKGLLVPKSQTTVVANWQSNEEILSKFDSLERTVKGLHIPEVTYDFDNIEKVVTKIIKSKNGTKTISKKGSGIW